MSYEIFQFLKHCIGLSQQAGFDLGAGKVYPAIKEISGWAAGSLWAKEMAGQGQVQPLGQSMFSEVHDGTGGSRHRCQETGRPSKDCW